MSNLVKYTEPKSLIHAVELAHEQKQWCSKLDDSELRSKTALIVRMAGEALRQTKTITESEISTIIEGLIYKIKDEFKTLHILEIETAIKNWVFDGSEEIKILSAAQLVKAVRRYTNEQRKALVKQIWAEQQRKESEPREYTTEEMREQLDLFYQTWKRMKAANDISLFGGYSTAFDLAKKLGDLQLDKSEYWAYIEKSKINALENLKTLQATRVISGVVYQNKLNEIEEITYESVFTEKKPLPSEVIFECRKLAVTDYFNQREFEE